MRADGENAMAPGSSANVDEAKAAREPWPPWPEGAECDDADADVDDVIEDTINLLRSVGGGM